MKTTRRMLVKAAVAVTGSRILTLTAPAMAQGKYTLSGEVLDRGNKPIDAVLVAAYRDAVKLDEASTGTDGRYTINYASGEPISTVRYQHTAYIEGVINNLCGTRGHTINKTLYLKGTQLGLFEAQDALASLERVFYIEEALKTLSDTRPRYVATLSELQGKIPKRLNARLDSVLTLFRSVGA